MMRPIAFAAALLVALASGAQAGQDKKFEISLKKVQVKGSSGDFWLILEGDTTFPNDAVISFLAKSRRHLYAWQEQKLHFGADFRFGAFDLVVPHALNFTVTGKHFKIDKLPVPMPGVYEISMWFDPSAQQKGDAVKKAMGRSNYFRYDFPAEIVTVGDSKKMTQELMDDTDECEKMIKKAMQLLERIEKESDDREWLQKAEKIFEEIGKLRNKAGQLSAKSLHSTTFKMIDDILYEVSLIGNTIKQMKDAAASPSTGGGGGGGGDDDPPSTHNENGGDTPVLGGIDGKKLSLKKTKEHIQTCDVVRMREYWSWETLLLLDSMTRMDATFAAAKADTKDLEAFKKVRGEAVKALEDVDRSFQHLAKDDKQKDAFLAITKYPVDDKDQSFADYFKMFDVYIGALFDDAQKGAGDVPQSVKDIQALVKTHLTAARNKALDPKKKSNP